MFRTRSLAQLAIFSTALASSSATAEAIYKWRGANGEWMYGSKPPAGAAEVQALADKSYSKYSSDKVIKAFKPSYIPAPSPSGKAGKEARASLNSTVKESDLVANLAKLEHDEVIFEQDVKGQISSCSVRVTNRGGEPAKDIVVSFQFQDGTLIPAGGPERLKAKEEAKYQILPEQLPVKLKGTSSDPADAAAKIEAPEVVLQFISDGSIGEVVE